MLFQDVQPLSLTCFMQISHYWNSWRDLRQLISPENWKQMRYIWGDIKAFESAMKPLEELERVLWSDYVCERSGIVEDELDEDELRKAIQELVAAGDGDIFSGALFNSERFLSDS